MVIHDTFVERFHEDVIDPRSHQVKRMMKQEVIGTTVMTQTRTQACCLRWKGMTRKIDVSLAHRWKWCSENKDQVAPLKSSRQWYSQTGYECRDWVQTHTQGRVLRVVESQRGLSSVIGVFECLITRSPCKIWIRENVVLDEELVRSYAVPW